MSPLLQIAIIYYKNGCYQAAMELLEVVMAERPNDYLAELYYSFSRRKIRQTFINVDFGLAA